MIDLSKFDWGWMGQSSDITETFSDGTIKNMSQYHKESIISEIFERNCYEKFFEVEENDIVVDIGASVGPFTYSILHKKPKQVFCFEPSEIEFKTLCKNVSGFPVIPIPKGISNVNSIVESQMLFGGEDKMETLTFNRFINLYNINNIDFLKTDCEGGEYDVFNQENLVYLKSNVKKIVGEWHLKTPVFKSKFRNFRDNILREFKNYKIFSVDGIDIGWDLWNDHFIEYYTEIIIYIDNR
jgi:FkbM family methyltransferase